MSLFPSTLIITSSPILAQKKLLDYLSSLDHQLDNNPDLFSFTDYTIATVRSLKKFLSQKPFNHQSKIVIIPDADKLNSESQNALLKTLEEPGPDNYLILTTSTPSLLLPTILSRCQKVKLSSPNIKSTLKLWPITDNPKKDLDFAASLTSDKTQIKSLLQDQLTAYQQQLITSPTKKIAQIINNLIEAIDLINCNVDPKSALDYFFLK